MKMYGRFVDIKCQWCGKIVSRTVGHVNRSRKVGAPLFCNKECSGLHRRKNKTHEQKKIEKRIYDMEYRTKNKAMLKAKKAKDFQNRSQARRDYEKEYRKQNMQRHVKYCQRSEYKEYKKKYDEEYRAKELGGEFWESYMLIVQLDKELDARMSWYDRQMNKGTLNKANQRRREYERESSRR